MAFKRSATVAVAISIAIFSTPELTPISAFSHHAHLTSDSQKPAGQRHWRSSYSRCLNPILLARAYGPNEDIILDQEQEEWERANAVRVDRQREDFARLIADIIACENIDHMPRVMTRNIELILNMRGFEGVALLKDIIEEAQKTGDEENILRVTTAVDYILTFAEEFVENATNMDEMNKEVLGKIVKEITSGWGEGKAKKGDRPGLEDEARLDQLFEQEKNNFTPGFLRHLEGECKRIAAASRLTPESAKMLETLRMIQARVVEELGQDLGEGAVILGQLLGYDDRSERLAVLDAGLTVRGVGFARELAELTNEALEGFERVPGGADPELIRIVSEIDERIQQFISRGQ